MAKILVGYYSKTGNTKRMAEFIADGTKMDEIAVDLKPIDQIKAADFLGYDAIIMGSPTYYGLLAASLKQLIDESVKHHGKLDGKIGGAFSSSANIGGGNETTIMSILQAWLIHGMIVVGDFKGDHYGPVSIGKPDHRVEAECKRYGEKIAKLVEKLKA